MMANVNLRQNAEAIFVGKDCDTMQANVQAAIITAASEMAKFGNIVTKEQTLDEMVEAYNAKDNEEVLNMLGMAPQFVKPAIGFSVDFNDYTSGQVNYELNKVAYDIFYGKVLEAIKEKEQALEDNGKQI